LINSFASRGDINNKEILGVIEMRKRIIATFNDDNSLLEAVKAVKELGFNDSDLSIFSSEGEKSISDDGKILSNSDPEDGYTFSDIGTGSLYDGGLASMLVNLGISPYRSQHFSQQLQEGKTLLFVQADNNEYAAAEALRKHGAQEVSMLTDYNAGLA